MLVLPETISSVKEPEDVVISIIQPHFNFPLKGRITTRADLNQFKYLEDSSVYAQARKGTPLFFEVYWDGVWICDFSQSFTKEQLEKAFFEGFAVEYESGRVTFSEPEEADEELDTYHTKLREISNMSEATPEDQIVKEAIKQTVEEKKKDRDKRKKIIEGKI
jgi:hypothetical protein